MIIINGLKGFVALACLFFIFLSCSNNHSSLEKDNSNINFDNKNIPFKYPSYLNKSFLQGHFLPTNHPDFVLIPDSLRTGNKMYLQKDALAAFTLMYNEIRKIGLTIYIRSATRNFTYQRTIWRKKWLGQRKLDGNIDAKKQFPDHLQRAKKILEYSSMPGTSRHHWGTDLDINSFDNSYFEQGDGLKIYEWMNLHAADYGFCQVYTKMDSTRPNGYQEEKWHWSYIPIASRLTKAYEDSISSNDLRGFIGFETAKDLNIINHYVKGINPYCN